jgi:ubiquinone/menaquinone biosynthesis C-methylase UbiE
VRVFRQLQREDKPMARKTDAAAVTADAFPTDGLDPLRVLAQLPLRPYQSIVDVRCSSGHFTIPLAKSLFDGRVYAMDSTGANLDELKQRAAQIRLTNIEVVTTKKQQQAIPAAGLDGALVPFILYRTEEKETFLKEVLAFLKKGAWIAVLDWQKKGDGGGPPLEKRISDAEVVALSAGLGLRFTSKRTLTSHHYLVLMRK